MCKYIIVVRNCDDVEIEYKYKSKKHFKELMETDEEFIPMLDDRVLTVNGKMVGDIIVQELIQ